MDKIEVINFHQTMDVNGIRLWGYTVKHILGADMFMVGTIGVHILYTGDYSYEEDCYLIVAETPLFIRRITPMHMAAHQLKESTL